MNDKLIMLLIFAALSIIYAVQTKSKSKCKDHGDISGCEFIESETIENCTVEILRCKKCGAESVGWKRNK